MKFETVNEYSAAVADYLVDEYGDMTKQLEMTPEQSNVVHGIINYCYEHSDSINNAAHYLLEFVKATSVKLR